MTTLLAAYTATQSGTPTIDDLYEEVVTDPNINTVDDACKAFFTSTPEWLHLVMRARNSVVGRLGFDVGDGEPPEIPDVIEVGQKFGVFAVLDRSDTEVLLGGDDKHFSMRISVELPDAGTDRPLLRLGTVAHATDSIGSAYLRLVSLGHGPIAKMTARRMANGG